MTAPPLVGCVVWSQGGYQSVHLAVALSSVAIGNVGGLLEVISMVAHWASGNKIDNIMVVRIIFYFLCH